MPPEYHYSILQKPEPLQQAKALVTGGVAIIGGTALLIAALASGVFASAQISSGKLSGTARVIAAAGASNGAAVQFEASGAPTPTPTPAPTPIPTAQAVSYTVVGNIIKNSAGNPVYVYGVDRPSLEWSCAGQAASGGAPGIPASDFTQMRNNWNASAVRIPLSQDRWLTGSNQYCSTYKQTVETAVSQALATGMIVILDLHWSDQGNLNTTSGQQCMPDQNSVTFWQQLAAIYKNNPNVWFELYNEPYPPGATQAAQWNTWLNGGTVTCTATVGGGQGTWKAAGMQSLVNTVRGTGANNIVIAGGLAYSSNLANAPVLSGGNVAYAVHPYINTSAPDGSTDGAWANNFGNQAAKAPVIATEFGDMTCGNATYDNAILAYFHAHNMSYTAWAWFAGGCSFPSLVTDNSGDCVQTMGCTIQADMKKY